MKPKMVKLKDIIIDPRLQMRAAVDYDAVADYAEVLDELPAAKCVLDSEGRYWLWDAHHTYLAYQKKNRNEMPVEATDGEFLDALKLAAGANAGHTGLRRTNEDKRIAITRLFGHPEFADGSDRLIAECSKTSTHFVAKIRGELEEQALKEQQDNAAKAAAATTADNPPDPQPSAARSSPNKPNFRKGKDGKKRAEPYRVLNGLIVCARCFRIGQAGSKCPACDEARETAARKANKKPKAKAAKKAAPRLTWEKIDAGLVTLGEFLLSINPAPSVAIDRCNSLRRAIKELSEK